MLTSRYALARSFRRLIAGHKKYRPFIVLTRSRTGSNLLISSLNSHPAIHAEGEIFARLNGRTTEEILNAVLCRRPRRIRAVGFKIFYYHPQDDEAGTIWRVLPSIENLHVIHLKRQNVLRTLVSRKIAGSRDVWTSAEEAGAATAADKQIELTPEEVTGGIRQTLQWQSDFALLFAQRPVLDVTYEQLVSAFDAEFRRITDFLGVPFHAPRSTLSRQNPEPLAALVRNYAELRRHFHGTEWADYFDA